MAGPALEALKYTGHEEELREMYANLLVTSLNVETAKKAHPSFVEVIKQLEPKEARLIKHLSERLNYPSICEFEDIKEMKRSSFLAPSKAGLMTNIYPELWKQFIDLCSAVNITNNVFPCLDNLKRLQLIEFTEINEFNLEGTLVSIFDGSTDGNKVNEIYHTEELSFTSFGQLFVDACVKEMET